MLVDTDLWLCLLDVSVLAGWRPLGTKDPDAALCRASTHPMQWEALAYFLPCGQSIDGKDAREIARCSAAALAGVSITEVPLQGKTFGEENTFSLLRLAASRDEIPRANTEAALEILSGPPKIEAQALIRFLQGGHVTIRPEHEPPASDSSSKSKAGTKTR